MKVIKEVAPQGTETIHEIFLDEIPVAMELIELPIFGKNKNVKKNESHKFILHKNRSAYLKITPGFKDRIPLEFEEKLLYALIKIGKRQQFNTKSIEFPNKIVTSLYELGSQLGCKNRTFIIDALNRLKDTVYEFKNSLYNGVDSKITEDIIRMNIVGMVRYVKLKDVEITDPRLQVLSHTSKLQELVEVRFEPEFLNNIQAKKGHILFSAEKLIKIEDGVARTIFMYCDKNRWRGENDLHYIIKAEKIASFVPLSWVPHNNIPKTVKRIDKAFIYLKENKLISEYIPHIEKPLRNSWFEVYFSTSRKDSAQIITGRENYNIVESEQVIQADLLDDQVLFDDDLKELLEKIVDKKLSKSTIKLIKTYFDKEGLLYIEACIEYAKLKATTNFEGYLIETLVNNYANVLYLKLVNQEKLNQKKSQEAELKQQEKSKISLKQQQEHINKQMIESDYYKLSNKDQFLNQAELLLQKYKSKFKNLFPENKDLKLELAFSIFAVTNNKSYNHGFELHCKNVLHISLSLNNNK